MSGWMGRIGSMVVVIVLLSSPVTAVPLIDSNIPATWAQSVSEFIKHYIEIYSVYEGQRQEEARRDVIQRMESDLLAIAVGSEVLATALNNVSRGHQNPQTLALIATKIRRSVASTVSVIREIDPNWPQLKATTDFLSALDQFQNGKFDFVDGRIWELSSARDMKPDETRQLTLALRAESQELVEIVKRLIVGTDAY
jgi:hypothetical protein